MKNKKTILERLKIVERIEDGELACEVNLESREVEALKDEPVDNRKDVKLNKLSDIREIYKKNGLEYEGNNTIFIINNFAKALPETLPTDVKRQSVLNLLAASGMDKDRILADGKRRIQSLDVFLQDFSNFTDENISKNEIEIKRLSEIINEYTKIINERKKLKQEQKSIVEYETQKIRNIIEFIIQG